MRMPSRHSGMDRRNPDCRDATNSCHLCCLGSGDPCRNDEFLLVPKLQLGNAVLEAPASSVKSSWSLQGEGSQAGAWEPVQLSRHTGRESEARVRRYPEQREVNLACPPWRLGSGNPCRNDEHKPVSTALCTPLLCRRGAGGILKAVLLLAALPFCIAATIAEESPAAKPVGNSSTVPLQATDAKPLADPTVMAPRFRDALKNVLPQTTTQPAATGQGNAVPAPKMPSIRLLGLISGSGGQASALLGIGKDQQPYLVTGGSEVSLTNEDSPGAAITLEVKSVSRSEVKLLLKPFNRMIILR